MLKIATKTEIGKMGLLFGVQQDVGMLNISMDDSLIMYMAQRLGDRRHQFDRFASLSREFVEMFSQASARHHVHRVVRISIDLARIKNLDNMRIIKSSDRSRFPFKLLAPLGILPVTPHHFQGNRSIEADLTGFENQAHPPLAENSQKHVITESAASQVHGRIVGV